MADMSPAYTGAWTAVINQDVDETEDELRTVPCHLGGCAIANNDATAIFVHFYNALAADVTVGTTEPRLTLGVAGTDGDVFSIPGGIYFDTALTVAATTTPTGSGGPGANEVVVTAFVNG